MTGTVPLGKGRVDQAAWARYESLVNEVLGPYDFHALCTHDTQGADGVVSGEESQGPHREQCVSTRAGRAPSLSPVPKVDVLGFSRAADGQTREVGIGLPQPAQA